MKAAYLKKGGFPVLMHPEYLSEEPGKLATHSTMAAEGGPFLWIGHEFHLSHREVEKFRDRLTLWLETGDFRKKEWDDEGLSRLQFMPVQRAEP